MEHPSRCKLLLLTFCLSSASALLASSYTFTTIDVPGAGYTSVSGIYARGQIVGSYVGTDVLSHGFLLHKHRFITIDVPGARGTSSLGINTRGHVVGLQVDDNNKSLGFLWVDGVSRFSGCRECGLGDLREWLPTTRSTVFC